MLKNKERQSQNCRSFLVCLTSGKRDSTRPLRPWRASRREVSRRRRVDSCHRHSSPTHPLLRGRVFKSRFVGQMQKRSAAVITIAERFCFNRASGIRTHDPLHPMQVRYQTALLPELFWEPRPCGASAGEV